MRLRGGGPLARLRGGGLIIVIGLNNGGPEGCWLAVDLNDRGGAVRVQPKQGVRASPSFVLTPDLDVALEREEEDLSDVGPIAGCQRILNLSCSLELADLT
ncbi:hypothetical protein BDW02DRAFT_358135, partial [Decorospora gaudefroyi]